MESEQRIVIAGAGYAGLHVAQRLSSLPPAYAVDLLDRHDYHQLLTELPQVASGVRAEQQVQIDLKAVLPKQVRFRRSQIERFNLADHQVITKDGPIGYWRLVLALGSRPNDFDIPGLAEQVLFMWSAQDAATIWDRLQENVAAAESADRAERARLFTVVIGGAGATGVELAGALAETLPQLARMKGLDPGLSRVVLVEAGHTILAGSSPRLIAKAEHILGRLGVETHTNSPIKAATEQGFELGGGRRISGGTYIWAGGVKASPLTAGIGLEVGYNGRVKVDRFLRAVGHPEVYVAGDLASVVDLESGLVLPPLAQIALDEADVVAGNLGAETRNKELRPFIFHSKGIAVSVGARRGVAEVAGVTLGGRSARLLKEAIEWEYRQSVKHLRGWSAA